MKFKYSVIDPSQNEFDSLPRITLSLSCNNRQVEVSGLVDSGATINVLPYQIGSGWERYGMIGKRIFVLQGILVSLWVFLWL